MGYYRAGGDRFAWSSGCLYTLAAYTLLMSALYILNQVIDMKSDAINEKHLLLAEGLMPVKNALLFLVLFLLSAAIISLKLPTLTRMFMAVSLILGILYSLPPFIIKARPLLDLAVNGAGYGFLNFVIGWLADKPYDASVILQSLPYVFAVAAIFVNTTILDIEGDRKCRYLTTGVLLGPRTAAWLALILIMLAGVASVYVRDWICLIPAAAAFPLFALGAATNRLKFITLSIRIGGPLLILAVGILFPYYLAAVLAIFLFLRIYYKKRFGISYPSL